MKRHLKGGIGTHTCTSCGKNMCFGARGNQIITGTLKVYPEWPCPSTIIIVRWCNVCSKGILARIAGDTHRAEPATKIQPGPDHPNPGGSGGDNRIIPRGERLDPE